jgi:hypothetical protein
MMEGMKSTELADFTHFWDHVDRAEQDIRENRYAPTPANRGDPWEEKDEEFFRAYQKVKRHLAKYRRRRPFYPPVGLMLRSGMYEAETAHEALMSFLIKPAEYESASVLRSPEYLAIKNEAQDELKDRQAALERSTDRTKRKRTKAATREKELGTLYKVILDHMLSVIREDHPKPLKWNEIRDRLPQDPEPWSQAKISRTLAELLDAPAAKGMTAYRRLFTDRDRMRGFMKPDLDGRQDVDGVVTDEQPDD